jgi:hypothetical protein
MQFEALKDEEMYVLVAPDGCPQTATLSPDYGTCVGFATLLASKGISEPPAKLLKQGYGFLRVKVTIELLDDEEAAFLAAKKKMGR